MTLTEEFGHRPDKDKSPLSADEIEDFKLRLSLEYRLQQLAQKDQEGER